VRLEVNAPRGRREIESNDSHDRATIPREDLRAAKDAALTSRRDAAVDRSKLASGSK
jgi:hypothetical protein